jgi:hypothetical protein
MEMKRASRRLPWRYASFATAYKYLSGYGEQWELTLLWLGIFIVVVFPILFILSRAANGIGEAILYSLEVPPFLKLTPNGTVESSIVIKILKWSEGLVVSGLVILLGSAAKRNLQKVYERDGK